MPGPHGPSMQSGPATGARGGAPPSTPAWDPGTAPSQGHGSPWTHLIATHLRSLTPFLTRLPPCVRHASIPAAGPPFCGSV